MDEVIKDAIGRYGAKIVGLDDSFEFRCTECGKCCTEREDILLAPRDLFRAAKECGMTVKDFAMRFCETYIGSDSRLPIVRFKPLGSVRRCPMLENRRCRIHKAKPVVCAMYPVGRAISLDKQSGVRTTAYLLNRVACGDGTKRHSVREWLLENGVPLHDEFYFTFDFISPTSSCTVVPGHISVGLFLPFLLCSMSFFAARDKAASSLPCLLSCL